MFELKPFDLSQTLSPSLTYSSADQMMILSSDSSYAVDEAYIQIRFLSPGDVIALPKRAQLFSQTGLDLLDEPLDFEIRSRQPVSLKVTFIRTGVIELIASLQDHTLQSNLLALTVSSVNEFPDV
ncbi:hypothetical protein ACQ4M3_18985 [Leptolyngbya sp. AN03gr2]|uniref:hypothetical protein n=1 Tax=Leptolyngbya sp. AN03gr2 TaxID=3423364 RepID=UPI003D31E5B9